MLLNETDPHADHHQIGADAQHVGHRTAVVPGQIEFDPDIDRRPHVEEEVVALGTLLSETLDHLDSVDGLGQIGRNLRHLFLKRLRIALEDFAEVGEVEKLKR
ncbi:hypothetical protein SDC9_98634 [bioreactor metagenome]|uniref:Uncharacterized protein n=1 Tax=bioreactor metagenome TaxID=1076179 RepID=A0A645AM27_9ZZZZ